MSYNELLKLIGSSNSLTLISIGVLMSLIPMWKILREDSRSSRSQKKENIEQLSKLYDDDVNMMVKKGIVKLIHYVSLPPAFIKLILTFEEPDLIFNDLRYSDSLVYKRHNDYGYFKSLELRKSEKELLKSKRKYTVLYFVCAITAFLIAGAIKEFDLSLNEHQVFAWFMISSFLVVSAYISLYRFRGIFRSLKVFKFFKQIETTAFYINEQVEEPPFDEKVNFELLISSNINTEDLVSTAT